MKISEFDLLRPDVFDRLRDLEWFIAAISLEYQETAASFGCGVAMSYERLIQSHDIFWHDADGGKVKNLPDGTISLDQFKLSSYLCFWLRRINPVREIRPVMALGEHERWAQSTARLSPEAENFILYGNEIAALLIAVKLAQYLSLVVNAKKGGNVMATGQIGIKDINQSTAVEYGKILKHKNISAHGINMALQMLCGIGQKVHFLQPRCE